MRPDTAAGFGLRSDRSPPRSSSSSSYKASLRPALGAFRPKHRSSTTTTTTTTTNTTNAVARQGEGKRAKGQNPETKRKSGKTGVHSLISTCLTIYSSAEYPFSCKHRSGTVACSFPPGFVGERLIRFEFRVVVVVVVEFVISKIRGLRDFEVVEGRRGVRVWVDDNNDDHVMIPSAGISSQFVSFGISRYRSFGVEIRRGNGQPSHDMAWITFNRRIRIWG